MPAWATTLPNTHPGAAPWGGPETASAVSQHQEHEGPFQCLGTWGEEAEARGAVRPLHGRWLPLLPRTSP